VDSEQRKTRLLISQSEAKDAAARFFWVPYNEVTARAAAVENVILFATKTETDTVEWNEKKYIVASMLRQIGEFFQPTIKQATLIDCTPPVFCPRGTDQCWKGRIIFH
jgi:hypothetical protein